MTDEKTTEATKNIAVNWLTALHEAGFSIMHMSGEDPVMDEVARAYELTAKFVREADDEVAGEQDEPEPAETDDAPGWQVGDAVCRGDRDHPALIDSVGDNGRYWLQLINENGTPGGSSGWHSGENFRPVRTTAARLFIAQYRLGKLVTAAGDKLKNLKADLDAVKRSAELVASDGDRA